jgi:hypothetical protein
LSANECRQLGHAVADAVDRRRPLDRQGGLELQRIARSARESRQMVAAAARDRARAFRAFLRIIRGPATPFWQALHDDRGSTLVRREREKATLDRRRGAMLGAVLLGARQCAFTRRQSKTTAGVRMKTSENRARTHDENENLFLGDAVSGTRLPNGGRHPRALLRDSVRFLQRFEFF